MSTSTAIDGKTAFRLRAGRSSWSLFSLSIAALKHSIAILAFLALWELLPRLDVVDSVFLPPFSEVLAAGWRLMQSGELENDAAVSLYRAVSGLALAILIAVPGGLILGAKKPLADLLDPLLEIFRNTAPLALLPVFTLVLGISDTSKIAMVVYSCVWPILLNTVNGVKTVDPPLIKAARSMGLSRIAVFVKVVLPASAPPIFTGIRLAAAYSILVLIAAEMVGAKAGLGYLVNAAQFNFQIADMYAGILTLSLLGLGINLVLVRIETRFSRWREP